MITFWLNVVIWRGEFGEQVFTGIIEKIAQVSNVIPKDNGMQLLINTGWSDIRMGESICVNGACLTALDEQSYAQFDLSPETLEKTCFDKLKQGDWVNLERSMPASGRFSGHYVTGHIDTCAKLVESKKSGDFYVMTFSDFGDKRAADYLIPKGSVCINGISLTINKTEGALIEVMIIPHTLEQTNLSMLAKEDLVNIEFDYFARLIAHQMRSIQREVI